MSERCNERVYAGPWNRESQCLRKAGHGPEQKYCKQHAEKYAEGDTVTWYRVDTWTEYSCRVTPVEVLSETDSTLLTKDKVRTFRENKKSTNYRYFKTMKEAVEFYKQRAAGLKQRAEEYEQQVAALERKLCSDDPPLNRNGRRTNGKDY